jgi:hypothetical protein
MVNTRNQYQNSGQALLPGLHRSRAPSMVGHHHEEDDREDPEVILAQLEQSIATLTELVTQFLVMKGKEAHSTETEHEEHNSGPESSKGETLGNSGNDNNISSSSSVPFKVEAKLEMKQLEVYFGLYQIQETQQISFAHLKMTKHALLWWESYVDALRIGKNPMVMKWEDFKASLKEINMSYSKSKFK